jgi:protein gp37
MAARLQAIGMPSYQGVVDDKGRWTGTLFLNDQSKIEEPLRWTKPRRIFVNSMSDLFHPDVPVWWIAEIFNVMASWRLACRKKHDHDEPDCYVDPGHTYLILTKRAERMHQVLTGGLPDYLDHKWPGNAPINLMRETGAWPLPNVWLGVSIEDQPRADERIPWLLNTPAAVRFISAEPLLGPVDLQLSAWFHNQQNPDKIPPNGIGLDWVICGGESGPHARPMHPNWARSLRDQCISAGAPFLFKQWGEWQPQYIDDPRGPLYEKVGKKKAGRLLDGQLWDQYPITRMET